MGLSELYNTIFEEEEMEKEASQDENILRDEADEMIKLAENYTEVGREMARNDFEEMEKAAAIDMANAEKIEDLQESTLPFHEFAVQDEGYIDYLNEKYFSEE